ncbi:MAG: hypothetical protein GMKNLPBB_00950 [Myxococcota bacterium]|nr:hypothetical protein [Myxococcota bacterium]
MFLNKWHWLPPFALAIACFAIGGWTGLVVWFFFSTVLLFHGTFLVNSLAHIVGQRRYVTTDTSRNSFMITFFTLGEGWHNNHHHYAPSARNGFYWWEIDITYYVIRLLELVGVAYDVRGVPKHIMERNRVRDGHFDVGLFGNWQQKAAQARQHAEDLRKQAGEFAEELMESTRKSAGEIVENTRKSAEELVILSKGPMGVKE